MKIYGKIFVILLAASVYSRLAQAVTTQTFGVFDVTFFDSGDTDGYATSQQNWTAEQITDVGTAINAWQTNIANTAGRQIKVHIFWNELDSSGTGILGLSGNYRKVDGTTASNYSEYIWKNGLDPGTTSYGFDAFMRYDITAGGLSWNFSENAPTGSEVDFQSVAAHEFGHLLGFSTSYGWNYDDWGWNNNSYSGLTTWDKNLVDNLGNRAINGGRGTPNNFNETKAYFDGANAVALYGGLVPICSSTRTNPVGISHLDESALGDLLMSPFFKGGQEVRNVSDLEWAMMKDMGWNIVPEPASILLFGIAVFCYNNAKRCRKS